MGREGRKMDVFRNMKQHVYLVGVFVILARQVFFRYRPAVAATGVHLRSAIQVRTLHKTSRRTAVGKKEKRSFCNKKSKQRKTAENSKKYGKEDQKSLENRWKQQETAKSSLDRPGNDHPLFSPSFGLF